MNPDLARRLDAVEARAWVDLCAAAPAAMGVRTEVVHGATLLCAPRVPLSLFNRAIGLGNEAAVTDDALDALDAALRAGCHDHHWIHLSDGCRDASLRERLVARGWAPPSRPRWGKFARGGGAVPTAPCSFEVRPVAAGEVGAVAAVIARAHGMPPPFTPWVAALGRRARWVMFGAFDGASPVAGGVMHIEDGAAWLGLGGTAPEHRGRGAQKALLAARVRHALAAGCALVTTETGEPVGDEPNPSYQNMRWCGFDVVCARENLARVASR